MYAQVLQIENNFNIMKIFETDFDLLYFLFGDGVGDEFPVTDVNEISQDVFDSLSIKKVVEPTEEENENVDEFKYLKKLKYYTQWFVDIPNNQVVKQYSLTELTFSEKKQNMIEDLVNIRYEKEISGIVIDGLNFSTDRQSQALINAAYTLIQKDNHKEINWKTADNNWIILKASNINFYTYCFSDYVENCFTNEHSIYELINSASENDWDALKNIDLYCGWPGKEYISP
jgi:hypothetical protein